jgi:hypothetical protein
MSHFKPSAMVKLGLSRANADAVQRSGNMA